ncbi:unnamed protein product, partial [Prunus brigantina]
LLVGAPLLGSEKFEVDNSLHIPSWSQVLKSSHHTDTYSSKAFELLSNQIHNGAVNWSSALPTAGESTFTEYYLEWLEDVLSKNTQVLKSTGLYNTVFASLFRYDRNAPVIRAFCEYWCPATNTLHTSQGEMSISLWDLHEIGGLPIIVRMTAWIKYWYRGPFTYKKPSRKTIRNKSQKPKEDSDPSGIISTALKHTEEEEVVFEYLGIADEETEKSYLAAFLACWLCKFVFPKDDVTLIRPGVFKVASQMAHGVSFGLAVPVLASIYKGLNDISSTDDPGNCTTVLPFHYVYGWLGEYFDTHFTSSSEKSIPIMARFSGRLSVKFFDDSTARGLFRTCGELKDDVRNGTALLVYSHWKSFLKIGSASTITLPTKDNIREFEVTSDYVVWWSKGEVVHHVPTVSELVPFNHLPIEGENDTLHPISGSGARLRGSFAQPHFLKPTNHASTSEMSCGEPKLGVADKTLHKVISILGNQIKSIILKASLERLPSFKDELSKLLTTVDNVGADVSSLRAMIDALMVTVVDYHSAHSTYPQKLSPKAQSDRLATFDYSLSIALALQQAEETHQFFVLESVQSANKRMEELKGEQEQLELRLHQLNESLSESDVQLSYHRREVTRLREDKIAVEGAPVLSAADAETLDTLRVSFERLRNGYKDLSWE